MKLIDEKGRLFGKINIFDFIVFLAIVMVIGVVGYKLIQRGKEVQIPTKTYIVTVKCSAMPDTFAKALEKDNRIYYSLDGFVNGKIVDIKEEPALIAVTTDEGKLIETESPSLKDVYVDIEVVDKLDVNEAEIKLGRYAIAVGLKTFALKTVYAMSAESTIIDIREK